MMSLDKPSALVQSETSLPKPRPLCPSQPVGKRRNSMGIGFKAPLKRRRRANSESQSDAVLPSHFLLGGNITDPLNLNSLLNEDVNRLTNQETPQSSPLPPRGGDPVEIVVPRDITDPLNLKGAPQKRRRHRHRHHATETKNKTNNTTDSTADLSPLSCELNTALTCREDLAPPPQLRRHTHPPLQGNHGNGKHSRRRRAASSCSVSTTTAQSKPQPIRFETPQVGGAKGHRSVQSRTQTRTKDRSRYQFGNCSRFYGYGGCYGYGEGRVGGADQRLALLEADWFRGKRVLDIGCGAGHVTLFIARSFDPAHILGVELDTRLVHAANQNIRHFLSHDLVKEERVRRQGKELRSEERKQETTEDQPGSDPSQDQDFEELQRVLASLSFPESFRLIRGPLCAPLITPDRPSSASDPGPLGFPHNVTFLQGDYVSEEEAAWPGRGLYDVIMCLGVAKWIQLQKGDQGVACLFKRAYQSLSPGGLFLLETQPWSSYCHSKRSSDLTFRNYRSLRLKPDRFSWFLTETVGFSSYQLLTAPDQPRPLYLFHKGPAHRK